MVLSSGKKYEKFWITSLFCSWNHQLFWSMSIIVQQVGFFGGLIAFLLAPITITFAPFYIGFAQGDWTLVAITYGGGIIGAMISMMDNSDK